MCLPLSRADGPALVATKHFGRLLVLATTLSTLPCVGYSPATAQTYSPFATFAAMSQAELANVQTKVTYLWVVRRVEPSFLITMPGQSPNLSAFVPFRRPGFDYNNDTFADASGQLQPTLIPGSTSELESLLDLVSTYPEITDGGADEGGIISFSLLKSDGGSTICFESILNQSNAADLFVALRQAIQEDSEAKIALSVYACAMGLVPDTVPTDVTGDVTIKMSGLRIDRTVTPPQWVGTIRLTNNTVGTISPPLTLVLPISEPSVRLVTADGYACKVSPKGAPYFNLEVGAGLAGGQSVSAVVRFENPDNQPIDLRWSSSGLTAVPKVYAGPGER